MDIPKDKKDIPMRCYRNGSHVVLPLEEAYRLFWASRFGWVLKLDFFRSGFGESAMSGSVVKAVYSSGVKFVLALLGRGALSVAQNDSCLVDEHGEAPSPNQMAVWASRFRKLFAGDKPYEFLREADERGICQPAYRMKPDETWLVVLGVEPDKGYSDIDVPWGIFRTPPCE